MQTQTDLATRHAAARRLLDTLQAQPGIDNDALQYLSEALEEDEILIAPPTFPSPDSLRGQYLAAVLTQAVYEIGADSAVYGEIPDLQGVWAQEATREACQTELASVVNDWLSVRLADGLDVPVLAGIDLNPRRLG